jgi:hypothetical protein
MYANLVYIVTLGGVLMPDDDRIPTSLTAPWKRVLRYLRGQRPVDETADAVASAMAELLDTAPLAPAEVIGLCRSYVKEWEDLPEAFRPQIGRTAAS